MKTKPKTPPLTKCYACDATAIGVYSHFSLGEQPACGRHATDDRAVLRHLIENAIAAQTKLDEAVAVLDSSLGNVLELPGNRPIIDAVKEAIRSADVARSRLLILSKRIP